MRIKEQTDYVFYPENYTPLVDIYNFLEMLYNRDQHTYNGVLEAMTQYDDEQFDIMKTLRGDQEPSEFGKIVQAAKINICGTEEAA
jgi:hypothetical protein